VAQEEKIEKGTSMAKVTQARRKKTRMIRARVDTDLLAEIELAAEERGLTVSEWLRDVAAEAAKRPRVSAVERLILRELSALRIFHIAQVADARGPENANRLVEAVGEKSETRLRDLFVELRSQERKR
jgi:antitoxin component of RelBE/YafQ-DinJ toxin-antitoxin module